MNTVNQKNCELLISNWKVCKKVFHWDTALIGLSCAAIYTSKGMIADEGALRQSRNIMKSTVGAFSNFRSTARNALVTIMATSNDASATLDRGLTVYGMLKERFWTSVYLPLAAMIIGDSVPEYRYQEIVDRTRQIYEKMKAEHPMLTSSEDSAFCAMMAMSDRSVDSLIYDMNACYKILKPHFFAKNSVQSLTSVLSLGEGGTQQKCDKVLQLFNKLKEKGHKYGTSYELATLGILALTDVNLDQICDDIIEIDAWLKGQKGFGIFSSVSKKQRLMYAGILAQQSYLSTTSSNLTTTAVNSTISMIVAQEAAMYAAIAASSAASAAASSN